MPISNPRLSHVGICVQDLEESARFYEALGFVETYTTTAGNDYAPIVGLETMDVELKILAQGERKIELIHHRNPLAKGNPGNSMNTNGLSHLAIYVDDIEEAMKSIEELGGTVVPGQRIVVETATETRHYQMCQDPNGVRVELIQGSVRG